MTTQLIWLRPTDPAKGLISGNMFHRYTKIDATSVRDLFENIDKYLEKIPRDERWNLFYSVPSNKPFKEAKKIRAFSYQDVLALDIDGIDIPRQLEYIPVVAKFLGVSEDEMTVTASGNGLHFILQLAYKIDLETLNKLQLHYNEVARKLTLAVNTAGLPGHFDQIFDQSRILRLPLTENRKDKKGENGELTRTTRQARLLQTNFTPHQLSLIELSGLQEVSEEEQVDFSAFQREFGKPDVESVLSGCEFLKWTRDEPTEVKEPLGYAALSILGRMDDDGATARRYIKSWTGSGSIQAWEPDQKIAQALGASGPRTCKNINSAWGKCATCAFNGKVKSPITIQGPNFIRTEGTGFHMTLVDQKGVPRRVPQPHDLRRFFERAGQYRVLSRRSLLRWDGTQYREVHPQALRAFAEEHYRPHVKPGNIDEFEDVVYRYNLVDPDWFTRTASGLINFKNEAVSWHTGQRVERTPEMGFRYTLPFDFDPEAKAPVWESFLAGIFPGDSETQRLIEEFMGYCLSNDEPWKQKAMLLLGSGANGKSTLLDVMQRLAGDGNYSTIRVDKFNEPTQVAMMDGKLFNVSGETPRNGFEETAGLKELSAGDAVTARRLYDAPYAFRNRAKIIFACNEIPRSLDNSDGFYRRFWVVPFTQTFDPSAGRGDAGIGAKLARELPGIFNRVWRAYLRVQQARGAGGADFTDPKTVREAGERFRLEMDVVGTWIAEHLTPMAGARTLAQDVYAAFRQDMEQSGHAPLLRAYPADRFSQRVMQKYPHAGRFKTKRGRGFEGLALSVEVQGEF